jgi:hypothetical protein
MDAFPSGLPWRGEEGVVSEGQRGVQLENRSCEVKRRKISHQHWGGEGGGRTECKKWSSPKVGKRKGIFSRSSELRRNREREREGGSSQKTGLVDQNIFSVPITQPHNVTNSRPAEWKIRVTIS